MRGTEIRHPGFDPHFWITPACAGNSWTLPGRIGRSRDHPRVCGEQTTPTSVKAKAEGSPPRVRGTDTSIYDTMTQQRITPACAGNRRRPPWPMAVGRDHPRVCGEQRLAHQGFPNPAGSPPRVRGTDPGGGVQALRGGITPACAGNSLPLASSPPCWWDHPRVCGEQADNNVCMAAKAGSPPRVRGTARLNCPSKIRIWITPACAGNRLFHFA